MVEKDIMRIVNAHHEELIRLIDGLKERIAFLELENDKLSDELARRGSANVTILHTKSE